MFILPNTISKKYTNIPINIDLVETFEKGKIPNDMLPAADLYTIEFNFSRIGTKWYFETEKERDKEYEKLLTLLGIGEICGTFSSPYDLAIDTLKNCKGSGMPFDNRDENNV